MHIIQLLEGGGAGSDYVEAFLSSYVEKKKLDSGLLKGLKNQVTVLPLECSVVQSGTSAPTQMPSCTVIILTPVQLRTGTQLCSSNRQWCYHV